MFSSYFEKIESELIKKYSPKKTAKKATAKKKSAKKTTKKTSSKDDNKFLIEKLSGIIPQDMILLESNAVDSSDYVAETSDFIACKKVFQDFESIFKTKVPCEFVKASFNICKEINRKNLVDTLVKVAHVKKLNHYTGEVDPEQAATGPAIPSFVIAYNSTYTFKELKESIIEIYTEENVESIFEFDIMIVLGKGIVVKNWRERRSFIALETEKDTMKWFFILMNEYLDGNLPDLRSYVVDTKVYEEY